MDHHLDHLIHEELEADHRDGSVAADLTCYYQPWTGLEPIGLESMLVSDVVQTVEQQHCLNPS